MPVIITNKACGKDIWLITEGGGSTPADTNKCVLIKSGIPAYPGAAGWDVNNSQRPGEPPTIKEIVISGTVLHLDAEKDLVHENRCPIQIFGGFPPVGDNQRWNVKLIKTENSIQWYSVVCVMSGKRLNAATETFNSIPTHVQLWTLDDGSPPPDNELWTFTAVP
jgi:hypothetical protein